MSLSCLKLRRGVVLLLMILSSSATLADDVLGLERVAENVFCHHRPAQQQDEGNFGNNANFGFVVTPEGVVLIDSGGSEKGAAEIRKVIDSVTDQPVKIVIIRAVRIIAGWETIISRIKVQRSLPAGLRLKIKKCVPRNN